MKKTVSLSALMLLAFPLVVFAQHTQPPQPVTAIEDSYFTEIPIQIEGVKPNHITGILLLSKQAGAPKSNIRVASMPRVASETKPFNITTMQTVEEIVQPDIKPDAFSTQIEVAKPTPANTIQEAPQNEMQVPVISNREQPAPAMADPMSIDRFRASQRSAPWAEKESGMRNVSDHFSPGGAPFAYRGVTGKRNFFGVDRTQCCDEWVGICNCGGGLKDNPGHLGLPWLRSKDNCDQTTSLFRGKKCRDCSPPARNDCGCNECNN